MAIHDLSLTAHPQSDNASIGLPDFGDSIDMPTFEQILEMDDDEEERDFSKSIVYGFFEQAEVTFQKMDMSLWVCPILSMLSASTRLNVASIEKKSILPTCRHSATSSRVALQR